MFWEYQSREIVLYSVRSEIEDLYYFCIDINTSCVLIKALATLKYIGQCVRIGVLNSLQTWLNRMHERHFGTKLIRLCRKAEPLRYPPTCTHGGLLCIRPHNSA